MYYVLFKRLSYNRFKCVGITDNSLVTSDSTLFRDRKDNDINLYIELSEKDMKRIKFNPGKIYKYEDGLIELPDPTYKKEYQPLPEDKETIIKTAFKLKNDYGIYNKLFFAYVKDLLELSRFSEDKERNDSVSKVLFCQGYHGCGKTYFLNAIHETTHRPSIIIDCAGMKPKSKRDMVTQIVERVLDYFNDDRETVNSAIIMLDNIDRIDVPDEDLAGYYFGIPNALADFEKVKINSKKYGVDRIQLFNNLIIVTSTQKCRNVIEDDINLYSFYEMFDYQEIKITLDMARKYVRGYLDTMKKYYLMTKGISLEFTDKFIEDFMMSGRLMGRGYYGYHSYFKRRLSELDLDNCQKIIFYSNNRIEIEKKKTKVLSNVR